MILKLRMADYGKEVTWRLLDKIKEIDYKFVDESTVLARKALDASILYINTYPKVADPKATKRVVEIYIVYEDGLGTTFYTDDMVFIMNDNGKTCDTVNVAR
jgi:ABC-type Fe3+ transport system substrate-binding protein